MAESGANSQGRPWKNKAYYWAGYLLEWRARRGENPPLLLLRGWRMPTSDFRAEGVRGDAVPLSLFFTLVKWFFFGGNFFCFRFFFVVCFFRGGFFSSAFFFFSEKLWFFFGWCSFGFVWFKVYFWLFSG